MLGIGADFEGPAACGYTDGGEGYYCDRPTLVDDTLDWEIIDVGRDHTCGISAGEVFCWGANQSGQLGDGTLSDATSPVAVSTAFNDWVEVSVGDVFTCGRRVGGEVHCWGSLGRKGDSGPLKVVSDTTNITAGRDLVCVADTSQAYECWGTDETGLMGRRVDQQINAPRSMPLMSALSAVPACSAPCSRKSAMMSGTCRPPS